MSADTLDLNSRISLQVNEAAVALGISRSSLYRLLHRGDIRSKQIAGRRVIPVSELHRLIND